MFKYAMEKHGLIGFMDVLRMSSVLILTILVGIFVAPIAPWVLWISVFACFYVFGLEFLKFYLGIKKLRAKGQIIPEY